jgi:hypothetical protein
MMIQRLLTYCIATVWLVNGLYCKLLNGVPRHQEIVGRILGFQYSALLTKWIGVSEVLMALWVVSGYWRRQNAIIQIGLVLVMNILEFALVPDLLLWGRLNLVFAVLFAVVIWWWGFRKVSG